MQAKPLMNESIRYPAVLLILPDGSKYGVITSDEAMEKALSDNLDLVLVSKPQDDKPAICKLMDYSKFLYKQAKTQKQHKSHDNKIKELWVGPNTFENDLETKARQIEGFLKKKMRVRYVMRLKGIEKRTVPESTERFKEILKRFDDIATHDDVRISHGKVITISTTMQSRPDKD
jgi:translation initiation factor IF-3